MGERASRAGSSGYAEVAPGLRVFIRKQDTHSRSLAKTVSWRIIGSVDTLILSFLFTGSLKLAGSIAGTEVETKIILYYLHERVW